MSHLCLPFQIAVGACHKGDLRLFGQAGPTTPEGLERSRKANWKHGYYSAKAKQERLQARIEVAALLKLIKQFSRSEG